jgi:lipopolysaccharide transport system ATP-binding protein
MTPIIEVKNLSKKYNITHANGGYVALRDVLANVIKHPFSFIKQKAKESVGLSKKEEFWALKDINFTVNQGEIIGIIGRNGAGKSTLLKILSQITPPTTGEIKLRGRVGSLLEVGTGFHPELTGRENIFLNGAILGMKKVEIAKKFDEIVEFAGVEKFLDTPVKYYSSGMYVRLAFSVAAHMEPDILIIDEVLAVGDAEFQKKCLGKMDDITKKEGRTVLFVSHNMGAVQSLCARVILLDQGKLATSGESTQVINTYLNKYGKNNLNYVPPKPIGEKGIHLLSATLVAPGEVLNNGKKLIFKCRIQVLKKQKFVSHVFVYREDDLAFVSGNFHTDSSKQEFGPGIYNISFVLPPYLLNPGWHRLGLMLADDTGNLYQILNAMDLVQFELGDDGYRRGDRYNLGWQGAVSPILEVNLVKEGTN